MSETPNTPCILLTNDDGIESLLLNKLVVRLASKFNLIVAAPSNERSFCGRSMTIDAEIAVEEVAGWPCKAYAVDGTPTDCVNIALGHLCGDQLPDLVISGPNIGRNTSLGFILGSGTVAGALEGAFWGVRALAISQGFENNAVAREFKHAEAIPGELDGMLEKGMDFIELAVERALDESIERLQVHSLNLPHQYADDAEDFRMVPAVDFKYRSFFRPRDPLIYTQAPGERVRMTPDERFTDIDCVTAGYPAWTRLDFASIT